MEDEYYDLAAMKLFKKLKVRNLQPEEDDVAEGWVYVYKVRYVVGGEWTYIGVGIQPFNKKEYSLKENILYYFWEAEESTDITTYIRERIDGMEEFEMIE